MASAYHEQCPSCEALIPIRDPSLIGRKVACPKCKYHFVVEGPGGPARARPRPAVPVARVVREESGPARRSSGSGAAVLLVGIGLGCFAMLALVVGGMLLAGVWSTPVATEPGPVAAARPS